MNLKNFRLILLLVVSCTLMSCGKNNIWVSKHVNHPRYEYMRPFAMSTNEKLLDTHPVIKEVDLREAITDLDNLPMEYETFETIYKLLKVDQNLYSKYVVLKKTADCQALIGYCKAYYIKK